MRSAWQIALLLACLVVGRRSALGQETEDAATVLIEVTVTASSGRSIYVDRGRNQGVEPGDRARLFLPGGGSVEGTVRSVASDSARIELDRDQALEPGWSGRIRIPSDRLQSKDQGPSGDTNPPPDAPDHPPWTHPPEEWNADLPLLAPTESITPEKREDRIRGSVFFQTDHTWDREGEDSRSLYSRTGTDLTWENPWRRGGQLELDAEFVRREVSFDGQSQDETESRTRLQRFSYGWGGTRQSPRHWEVGRFLQKGVPAFGLLDGVEVTQRLEDGSYLGFATGFLPEPNFELATGDDLQAAAYYRRDLPSSSGLGWGVGAQKTWNNGSPDRDLLASDFTWIPNEHWSVRGSALVDYYTSNERAKDGGLELTELHLYGDWRRSRDGGASLSYDQFRWPDIERNEVPSVPPEELRARRSQRAGLRLWRQASEEVRLSGRANLWENEDDDGSGGELRIDWRDLLWSHGQVAVTLFSNDGEFSSIRGLRLGVDRDTDHGYWSANWEIASSEQEDFFGTQEELVRQTLRGSWDHSLGKHWSLSLFVEELFGDSVGATSLGFYLQRRLGR